MAYRETIIEFRSRDGLALAASAWGDPADPVVLLLHGGGQTRFAWGSTACALAGRGYYGLALDARGHGESAWAGAGGYSLDSLVDDIEDVVDQLRGRGSAVALVGASLGGMVALSATTREPQSPAACLVLVDITPRTEPEGVRRIVDFMRAKPEGFASLDDAADAVAEFLPHRPRPSDPAGLAKNLRQGEDGRYRWRWDPAFVGSAEYGRRASDTPAKLESAARALRLPTLLVRGGRSDVVSEETAQEFLAMAPHAEYRDVAGAAHMVAGDRNDAFSNAVIEFLERVYPPGSVSGGTRTGA